MFAVQCNSWCAVVMLDKREVGLQFDGSYSFVLGPVFPVLEGGIVP